MKIFKPLFLFLSLYLFSCTNLDEINNRLDDLENRVDRIEEAVASLRTAYEAGKIITAVKPISNGWEIQFSDNSVIDIYNGKDGANGADGADGINGADGADGLTPPVPLLRVTLDGYWEVSYDNGANYAALLGADGNPVKAVGRDGTDGVDGLPGFPGEPGQPGENGADGADGEDGADGLDGRDGLCVRVTDRDGKYVFEIYDPENPEVALEEIETPLPADPSAVVAGISQNPVTGETIITLADGTTFTFGAFKVTPTSVVLLGAGQRGATFPTVYSEVTVDFRINPSNADLNLTVGSEGCQAALDLVGSYSSRAVKSPENFALKSIAPVYEDGERRAGQYRATIVRTEREEAFEDDVVFVIRYTDANGEAASLSSEAFTVKWNGHDYAAAFTTGLPVVKITTPDYLPVTSKAEWTPGATMTITMPDGTVDYQGTLSMKIRGNTTSSFPKKPYALKLDAKEEILGMPKHKRWCLLANWMDRTLLRNDAAFAISRATDLAYTPRGQFVELVMNGVHVGNYYLCEQIKVDKNRVNIAKLEADELTGGYLFEIDNNLDEAFTFMTETYKLPWMFKDPDEDLTDAQVDYVKNYVKSLEDILHDYARLRNQEYLDYIDCDSFIDWWLVQELSGNTESHHPKSVYMHKDRDGVLVAGPTWDHDWGTFTPTTATSYSARYNVYYQRLFLDAKFKERVKERWQLLRARFEAVPDQIEAQSRAIAASEALNHEMWPITPEPLLIAYEANGDAELSFKDAVARLIKSYTDKIEWLDKKISAL